MNNIRYATKIYLLRIVARWTARHPPHAVRRLRHRRGMSAPPLRLVTFLVRGSGDRLEFNGSLAWFSGNLDGNGSPTGRQEGYCKIPPTKTGILRICLFGRHSSLELEALSRGALTPTLRSERSAALVSTAQFRLRFTCIPRVQYDGACGPR